MCETRASQLDWMWVKIKAGCTDSLWLAVCVEPYGGKDEAGMGARSVNAAGPHDMRCPYQHYPADAEPHFWKDAPPVFQKHGFPHLFLLHV